MSLESGVARHLPGRHDQSSHGRKGPRAAAKKATPKVGEPVEKVVEKPPGKDATNASVPNDHGGTVRPLRQAPGPYKDLRPKSLSDTDTKAQALHRRMQAGNPWTIDQRDALVGYSGEAHRRMNSALRDGATATAEVRQLNAEAHAAMREIPDNIVTYRGVTSHPFGFFGARMTDRQAASIIGRTFHDPGFTSTSVDVRPSPLSLRVSVPAGTRGAYITSISKNPDEYEMLLDRGTHFKITKFDRVDGALVLYVTVVGQDE